VNYPYFTRSKVYGWRFEGVPTRLDLPAGSIISSRFSDDRRFDVKNGMKLLLSESSSLGAIVAVKPMDYL